MGLTCKYVHLDTHALHHIFIFLIYLFEKVDTVSPKGSDLSGILTKMSQFHVAPVLFSLIFVYRVEIDIDTKVGNGNGEGI